MAEDDPGTEMSPSSRPSPPLVFTPISTALYVPGGQSKGFQSVPPPWCETAVVPWVHDSSLMALTEASAATSPVCNPRELHVDFI